VYAGSQFVHVTTDGGRSWTIMSPDLTRNDKSRMGLSGGLTPDNIGVEYSGVLFAIAESPKEKGTIWAGSNDGLVHITRDNGKTWTNVTANIPGMLGWGTVSNIEPSRYDAATAYMTVDGHQVNNRDPWVYKTSDYGKTWKLITNGVPKTPLSYAHVVREDPVRRGLLYLGTEGGLYVSFDDGGHWQDFQSDLPRAPVYWLTVQERFNDLVIATYGRGFYIVDDITPLRTMNAEAMSGDLNLFPMRNAYRFRAVEAPYSTGTEKGVNYGETAPYGAGLTFWVKSAGKMDSATVSVADAAGAKVHTFKVPAKTGLNRAWWDLTGDRTVEARIRVSPLYSPWLAVPMDGKPAPGFGRAAILQPPGKYTVTVTFGGKSVSQPVTILKDPASGGSDADIAAQGELLKGIMTDLDTAASLVNEIEKNRAMLALMRAQAPADSMGAMHRAMTDSLDKKLLDAEWQLRNVLATGRGQDGVRNPVKIAEQLNYLANSIGNSDYAPTEAQRAVAKELHDRLMAAKAAIDTLMKNDVMAYHKAMMEMHGKP
jgi:hypothetical protein